MTTTTKRRKQLTAFEAATITAICGRVAQLSVRHEVSFDFARAERYLIAAHQRTPLQLVELLRASNFDITHDVFGIMRHGDPRTGEMRDCFLPRYSA